MEFKTRNKVDTTFNFSSLTDVVFLLLIFFMLTSPSIIPSGLPVNLPSSKSSTKVTQEVKVTIMPGPKYYIDDSRVSSARLEETLRTSLQGKDGLVVLYVDKSVPVEHLVKVAGIANTLNARVSVATRNEGS